jgi:predicted Zn-ribbon and HTH transcriptional regulator
VTCKRCGKTWPPRIPSPRVCPGCHSAWWDLERGEGHKTVKKTKTATIESAPIRKEYSAPTQTIEHPRQPPAPPVYQQPPVHQQAPPPLVKPPQMPDGIKVPDEFYPGQHTQHIQKGREAVSTMLNDLGDPTNTSINPDKDMGYPIRKCKKCGFVGYPPQMSAHKCM